MVLASELNKWNCLGLSPTIEFALLPVGARRTADSISVHATHSTRREYYPKPPARRSESVGGNVPSDAGHNDLWRFFMQPIDITPTGRDVRRRRTGGEMGARWSGEAEGARRTAIVRFDGLLLHAADARCMRTPLVCSVRGDEDGLLRASGDSAGGAYTNRDSGAEGFDRESDHERTLIPTIRPRGASRRSSSASSVMSTAFLYPQLKRVRGLLPASGPSLFSHGILVSQSDVDLSICNGVWVMQRRYEAVLDLAFRTAQDVFLVFRRPMVFTDTRARWRRSYSLHVTGAPADERENGSPLREENRGGIASCSGSARTTCRFGERGTSATHGITALMNLGLGPAEELQKHKIRVVRDLPFGGKNLLDAALLSTPRAKARPLSSASILHLPLIDPKYTHFWTPVSLPCTNFLLLILLKRARPACLHQGDAPRATDRALEPLSAALDLHADSNDQSTFFWLGNIDPDTTSLTQMGTSPASSVVDAELLVGTKNLFACRIYPIIHHAGMQIPGRPGLVVLSSGPIQPTVHS
ncbi:hypothetical protein B0H11DRAFT_1939375 [Mycena galericulata]|nr:hypothetical protein B0H11DRAFT_1939375 [Mycena galericulata]